MDASIFWTRLALPKVYKGRNLILTIQKEVSGTMPTVEFEGQTFNVDEDGFIDDFKNWNETWVRYVKNLEGIEELTEEHWKVINVLQDYYKKNGIAPMVRILSKVTGFKLKHIYELFPSGPGKGACKMAGLPKPTGCV